MPPKKGFFGKVNYEIRNIQNDFLEKINLSTNKVAQIKKLVPVNPRLQVADGLYDKGN